MTQREADVTGVSSSTGVLCPIGWLTPATPQTQTNVKCIMFAGIRTPARRTIASRPVPSPHHSSVNISALRGAVGPGFQTGATERLLQQAVRR